MEAQISKKILDRFDYFLLDIYGLIHDEMNLFSGSLEFLGEIKKRGKKAVFISNAPRKAEITAERLKKKGIMSDLYEKVFTSGQVLLDLANSKIEMGVNGKYFAFGESDDLDLIEGKRDFSRTNDINEADFLISFGLFENKEENDKINEKLELAKRMDLMMLCPNPDIIVKQKNNTVEHLCAGYVASLYRGIGGEVTYYGKPYSFIYQAAWEYLGKPDKSKLIGIGDSVETDVLGANNFGISSALVLTGILSHGLNNNSILEEEYKKHNTRPTFVFRNLIECLN